LDDLEENRLRFNIALQSFSPEINGAWVIDPTIDGIIVDGAVGVSFHPDTGILTVNFNNLYESPTLQTQKTRLQITVFLKKAGFKNDPVVIGASKVKNLLELS
jgi:hypothetical protein